VRHGHLFAGAGLGDRRQPELPEDIAAVAHFPFAPMRRLMLCAALVASARLGAPVVAASAAGASSPEALAELVMRIFSSGTPEEFSRVYPDSAGRVFM